MSFCVQLVTWGNFKRLERKYEGFVYCVFSVVQDPDVEIIKNLRELNIQVLMSVMEWVAEFFDEIGKIVSEQ